MTTPEPPAMLNRRPPDFARAGFGEDSVSVPGAAIRTVQRGVESAREVVPTAEELRAELRARLSQEREARQAEAEQHRWTDRQRVEEPGARKPEPVQTAAAAINRSFGGDDGRGGASVQIRGEISRYHAHEDEAAAQNPPELDVRA